MGKQVVCGWCGELFNAFPRQVMNGKKYICLTCTMSVGRLTAQLTEAGTAGMSIVLAITDCLERHKETRKGIEAVFSDLEDVRFLAHAYGEASGEPGKWPVWLTVAQAYCQLVDAGPELGTAEAQE